MNCPKCLSAMANLNMTGVVVDRCGACGGTWLDALEAEKLRDCSVDAVDGKRADLDLDVVPDAVECPRCDVRMMVLKVEATPAIYFEHCGKCNGVFLDSGELKAMSDATLEQWLRATIPGVFRLRLKAE